MKQIRKIAIIILMLLAISMLFIGVTNNMLPPALTGVGFGVIALIFLIEAK